MILSLFQIALDWAFDGHEKNNLRNNNITAASEADYCIYIEISDRTLYLLDKGKPVKSYLISPGMSGLPSPLGYWNITEKGDWGEGFGGRWLGLNVPWGT